MSSRGWSAIYTTMLSKAKYRRLSPKGRGALLHVLLLAGTVDPEATWPNRDAIADLLILDGWELDQLDELIGLHWLDQREDGSVIVHDWDQHQLPATDGIRRRYEADRKADWRRRKRVSSPPTPLSPTGQDITGTQQDSVPKSPGPVPDLSRTRREETCVVCRRKTNAFDSLMSPDGWIHHLCRDAALAGAVPRAELTQ